MTETIAGARAMPPPVRIERPRLFVLLLAALSTAAPLSTDMYLPALPTIARSLGSDESAILLTLSSYFVGFGAGQLVWGPISDRLGRRVPMIAGTLLYILASIACARADTAGTLIFWRFIQAFGGCAPPALAQAMVRDVYDRDHGARTLSLMQLVGALAPLVAPLIGAQILLAFSWRALFWILAGFGLVSLLGIALVPETLPPARRPGLRGRDLISGYGMLLTDRRFLGYMLSSGLYSAGLFGYLSAISFVFIEYYGVKPQDFGWLFGVNIFGMMLANFTNSRLVLRVGSERILRRATVLGGVAGASLIVIGLTGWGGIVALAAALFCYISLAGLIGANATAGALANLPTLAGTAAGLMGTLRFGFGALSSLLISALADGSPRPMAGVIGLLGVSSLVANRLMLRRRRPESH